MRFLAVLQLSLQMLSTALGTVDSSEWCQYVSKTPEPDVIFYNAIPKAGSATLKKLLKYNLIKNAKSKFPFRLQEPKLAGLSREVKERNIYSDLEKLHAQHRKSVQEKFVIAGHFHYFPFNASKVSYPIMERMQLVRDCRSWYRSAIAYTLTDAYKDMNKDYEKYQMQIFGVPNGTACILNSTCWDSARFHSNNHIDLKTKKSKMLADYFGIPINASVEEAIKLATTRISPARENFIAYGLTYSYSESLELLECVFPTEFEGQYSMVLCLFWYCIC
jgi:hypothetical protein